MLYMIFGIEVCHSFPPVIFPLCHVSVFFLAFDLIESDENFYLFLSAAVYTLHS